MTSKRPKTAFFGDLTPGDCAAISRRSKEIYKARKCSLAVPQAALYASTFSRCGPCLKLNYLRRPQTGWNCLGSSQIWDFKQGPQRGLMARQTCLYIVIGPDKLDSCAISLVWSFFYNRGLMARQTCLSAGTDTACGPLVDPQAMSVPALT